MLNFGIIKKKYENNNAVVTISPNGSMSYPSSIDTAEGYCQGILRYNNTSSSKFKVNKVTAPTTATLSCVSNCSQTCSIEVKTFRTTPSLPAQGGTQINANSYKDWNVGGVATLPPNCSGVFEGTVDFTCAGETISLPAKVIVGDIPTITITPQDDLDFGDILSTTASTVSVGTNGVRTCSPASVCVANQSSNGTFRVENSSATAQTFTVDCPSGAVQMGNGNNFYIDSFICSASSSSVSSSTPATVNVGATLHVPQGQAVGNITLHIPLQLITNAPKAQVFWLASIFFKNL